MRIKRFNELFDTEDLKSEHEVDYLKGDINKIIGSMKPIDFENDNIVRLIDRIIREVPFFAAFKDEVSGYGYIADIRQIEELNSYTFNVVSEKDSSLSASLLIKINSMNSYDAYVVADEANGHDGLDYSELIQFINTDYKKILVELGLDDIMDYNNSDGTINN